MCSDFFIEVLQVRRLPFIQPPFYLFQKATLGRKCGYRLQDGKVRYCGNQDLPRNSGNVAFLPVQSSESMVVISEWAAWNGKFPLVSGPLEKTYLESVPASKFGTTTDTWLRTYDWPLYFSVRQQHVIRLATANGKPGGNHIIHQSHI